MVFGDIAGLPERLGNDAGIADRILGPIIDACSGVLCEPRLPGGRLAPTFARRCGSSADHLDEVLAMASLPMAEPPPTRGHTGATTEQPP